MHVSASSREISLQRLESQRIEPKFQGSKANCCWFTDLFLMYSYANKIVGFKVGTSRWVEIVIQLFKIWIFYHLLCWKVSDLNIISHHNRDASHCKTFLYPWTEAKPSRDQAEDRLQSVDCRVKAVCVSCPIVCMPIHQVEICTWAQSDFKNFKAIDSFTAVTAAFRTC